MYDGVVVNSAHSLCRPWPVTTNGQNSSETITSAECGPSQENATFLEGKGKERGVVFLKSGKHSFHSPQMEWRSLGLGAWQDHHLNELRIRIKLSEIPKCPIYQQAALYLSADWLSFCCRTSACHLPVESGSSERQWQGPAWRVAFYISQRLCSRS